MKISNDSVRDNLIGLMDEEGWSVDDCSAKTGVSRPTLYRILDGKQTFVQRSIVRKIAETTGRKFVIDGDSVTFIKAHKPENPDLSDEEKQFLAMFRQLDETAQDAAIDLLESMCRVAELGKKRRERSNSSGS